MRCPILFLMIFVVTHALNLVLLLLEVSVMSGMSISTLPLCSTFGVIVMVLAMTSFLIINGSCILISIYLLPEIGAKEVSGKDIGFFRTIGIGGEDVSTSPPLTILDKAIFSL